MEVLQILLGRGADPNAIQKGEQLGWTVLHWAAYLGRKEMVKLLLAGGGNPNIADRRGKTPTFYLEHNS